MTDKDETGELSFKVIRETINIYETKKFFFMLKLIVDKVTGTNKKDKSGIPIVRFASDVVLSTREKILLQN